MKEEKSNWQRCESEKPPLCIGIAETNALQPRATAQDVSGAERC